MTAERRPYYNTALTALQSAHDACFNAPGRDVLGMSSGPFSGVNVALGIVAALESESADLLAAAAPIAEFVRACDAYAGDRAPTDDQVIRSVWSEDRKELIPLTLGMLRALADAHGEAKS